MFIFVCGYHYNLTETHKWSVLASQLCLLYGFIVIGVMAFAILSAYKRVDFDKDLGLYDKIFGLPPSSFHSINKIEIQLIWIWCGTYLFLFVLPWLTHGPTKMFDAWESAIIDDWFFPYALYLLFIPHLYLIIRYTIIGYEVDITDADVIKHIKNNEKSTSDSLLNLKALKDSDFLNDDEYNKKKEELLESTYKKEFMMSDEYKKLLELKKAGVLTSEFIEEKIIEVVKKRVSDQR